MTYEQTGAFEQPRARGRTSSGDRRRYKSSGRGKNGKKAKPTWRKFLGLKAFLLYFLGLILLFIIGVGIAYTNTEIPAQVNENLESESTIVYWSDGETELGRFEALKRIPVGTDEMPQHLREAVVAAEDRSFYENQGFDPVGIARAGMNFVTSGGEIDGGGSTISQQYVKNLYFSEEQTISRKVNELFVSIKVNQEVSKDDILTDYLNLVWFGGEVHGVEVAAQRFFGTSVSEINLAQSISLAALIKNPSLYDPRFEKNAGRFKERFDYVLNGMVETGAIDRAEAEAVERPKFKKYKEERSQYKGTEGYLLLEVKRELTTCDGTPAGEIVDKDTGEVCEPPIPEEDLNTGGYRIVSTFDKEKQEAAVKAVKEQRPKEDADNVHVALASVVPGDGAVVAMYGGPNALKQQTNDAVQAKKQVGSTFKPFTLVAGLENGISLDDGFAGNSPFEHEGLGGKGEVNNEDFANYGTSVDLIEAMERSINTAFMDLIFTLGDDQTQKGAEIVAEAAQRAGIPENPTGKRALADYGERLTLGTAELSAVDLATGYATIAAEGQQADWYTVKSVTDSGGNVQYEGKQEPEAAIDPAVAADVTLALQEVVEGDNGTGKSAQEIDRPSAGKTGTHEEQTAWYAGFTPQLATAVGIFREDYSGKVRNDDGGSALELVGVEGVDHMAGGSYPLSIWMAFTEVALEGEEIVDFGEGDDDDPTESPTQSPTPTDDPTDEPEETRVPSVVGRSLDDAQNRITRDGLVVGSVTEEETDQAPAGTVIATSPEGGTVVEEGTAVGIVVAKASEEPEEIRMPSVLGKSESDAVAELQSLGLSVDVRYIDPDSYPAEQCGTVIDQDPSSGSTVRPGDSARIAVPRDPDWGCSSGDDDGGGNGNEGGGNGNG